MRISSSLAVGSPTARVTAILVTTLLVASLIVGAGVAGGRLLAADDTIVVDQAGDITSIAEAVALAQDGDTIVVMVGTYDESVAVAKDITIRGGGDRADVIVENSAELPPGAVDDVPGLPFAFRFEDATAALQNLTLRGESARIDIAGGAVTLSDLHLDGTGRVFDIDSNSSVPAGVDLEAGANVTITATVLDDAAIDVENGSIATVTKSEFNGGYIWMQGSDVSVDLVDNDFTDNPQWAAVSVQGGASARITDNDFIGGGTNIEVKDAGHGISDRGSVAEIVGNRFEGGTNGITADGGTAVDISGNRFVGMGGAAARVARPVSAAIRENTMEGGLGGITVSGDVDIDSNVVTGVDGVGLLISGGSPVLTENQVCDNGTNLLVADGATPDIQASNEICPDPVAE